MDGQFGYDPHAAETDFVVDDHGVTLRRGKLLNNFMPFVTRRYRDEERRKQVLSVSFNTKNPYSLRSFFGLKNKAGICSILYESYDQTVTDYVEGMKSRLDRQFSVASHVTGDDVLYVLESVKDIVRAVLHPGGMPRSRLINEGIFIITSRGCKGWVRMFNFGYVTKNDEAVEEDFNFLKKLIHEVYLGHQLPPELVDLL